MAKRVLILLLVGLGGLACQRDVTIGGGPDARPDGSPQVGWAISAGGAGADGRFGQIAIDGAGDVVITGPFSGTATFGGRVVKAAQLTGRYVAKLRSTDRMFVWVTPIQGKLQVEYTSGLATDDAGHIYLAGSFSGTASFGEGPGSIALNAKGEMDIFVAKLDAGGTPIWAVSAASGSGPLTYHENTTHGYRVATDSSTGEVTVAGAFRASGLGADVFVARLGSDGRGLWTAPAGAGGNVVDAALGLAVDRAGNSYLTGYFGMPGVSSPAVATFGDVATFPVLNQQLFVAKIGASGQFVWAVPGELFLSGYDLALDDGGNIYVAIGCSKMELPLAARLNPEGVVTWVARAEGEAGLENNGSLSLLVGGAGHATLCGAFSGRKDLGGQLLTAQGDQDMFLAGLDPQGKVVWAQQAGGSGLDMATSLARDREGNLYVAGTFEQTADFGGVRLTSQGESDLFVWKIPAAVQ